MEEYVLLLDLINFLHFNQKCVSYVTISISSAPYFQRLSINMKPLVEEVCNTWARDFLVGDCQTMGPKSSISILSTISIC
jgi:hypothetical protein